MIKERLKQVSDQFGGHPGFKKLLEPEVWMRKTWHMGSCALLAFCFVILPFGVFYPWFVAATLLWIIFEFVRLTPWGQSLPLHTYFKETILKAKEQEGFTAGLQTVLAVLIVTFILQREIAILALLYLAFGDTIANVVGVSFNGPKFYKNKSVPGTFALFIFAFILTFIYMMAYTTPLVALFLALIGGLSAGLFEAYPFGLDDNASLTLGPAIVLQLAYIFLTTS
jgi:dolichol kinase